MATSFTVVNEDTLRRKIMNIDMSKVEAFAGTVVTDIAAAFSGVIANVPQAVC